MNLDFLDFDFTEDADGHGSFDAMAAASPAQLPALQAEVVRVLDWAHREFALARGPLEDGGEWDYEVQGLQEAPTTLAVHYDPSARRLDLRAGAAGPARVTLSLTITGTPAFCEAFRRAFGIE